MHTQRASSKVYSLLSSLLAEPPLLPIKPRQDVRTGKDVRPDLGTLLHHTHAQLCALGIGQLLETDGGGEALCRGSEGEEGQEDDVA